MHSYAFNLQVFFFLWGVDVYDNQENWSLWHFPLMSLCCHLGKAGFIVVLFRLFLWHLTNTGGIVLVVD